MVNFNCYNPSFLLRRSEYYALGYASNDIVLVILWIIAMKNNSGYISVVICFVIFLINDLYGYYNWLKMKKFQAIMKREV